MGFPVMTSVEGIITSSHVRSLHMSPLSSSVNGTVITVPVQTARLICVTNIPGYTTFTSNVTPTTAAEYYNTAIRFRTQAEGLTDSDPYNSYTDWTTISGTVLPRQQIVYNSSANYSVTQDVDTLVPVPTHNTEYTITQWVYNDDGSLSGSIITRSHLINTLGV